MKNFECDSDFVMINGHNFMTSYCARKYDAFSGLYDMSVKLSSIDMFDQDLAIDIRMLGITQRQGQQFLQRFLQEIQWER